MAKSAAEIVIERFLKDVEEKESMPWQRPYENFNSFNYFTKLPYRGINRLFLPFGEYITANQINAYNKEKGEDFKFQKGIKWYPVVFFKRDTKTVDRSEVEKLFPEADLNSEGYVGKEYSWTYYRNEEGFYKVRNILRYTDVADREWFKNSKGETLPSRIETGEVTVTYSDAQQVADNYIERSGIAF